MNLSHLGILKHVQQGYCIEAMRLVTNIFAKYMGKEICGYDASFTEELGSILQTLSMSEGYNEET